MKTKLVCPQCKAKMSVVAGIDTEVKCPLCRIPMQSESSAEPSTDSEQAAKPSFPSIKVARPVGDFTRTGGGSQSKPAAASQPPAPSSGATTITKTATPVSINLPKQAGAPTASPAEARERAEKILASARRQAEELANDIISRADQEAQEILNTVDQQVQPRVEKLLREAEGKAAKTIADSKLKAEEEAGGAAKEIRRKAEEEAKGIGDKARREAAEEKDKISRARQEAEAAKKNLESETQKAAASREEKKKELQSQQEGLRKQQEELRKQREEARQQALDAEREKKTLEKQRDEARKKAAETISAAEEKARQIMAEARRKAPSSDPSPKSGATEPARQQDDGKGAAVVTEKTVEPETADKALMRRHKTRMDGYARREAKFITAGISLGMIVLIYCLAVLFMDNNLDPTVSMMTYGVIVVDLLMVGWLTMLIRSHYVKGNEAIKAHRERNAVRREENHDKAGRKAQASQKKNGVNVVVKGRKPLVKPSLEGQLKKNGAGKSPSSREATSGGDKPKTQMETDKFAALKKKKKKKKNSGKKSKNK